MLHLYKWRKDYQNRGVAVPSNKKKSQDWTAEDKLAVVIGTASLNEIQLSENSRVGADSKPALQHLGISDKILRCRHCWLYPSPQI
jgi:hypothetical protein